MLKVFNLLNGVFYTAYGLWGLCLPHRIAKFLGFEDPGVLGLHQIRALWAGVCVLGLIILWNTVKREDQRALALCLVLVTFALAVGRGIGMLVDGSQIQQTYYETGFEVFWGAFGYLLYRRAKD